MCVTACGTACGAAVCIGFSAYITGVFGMNLDNTGAIQQQKGLFAAIVGATFFLIVVGIGLVIGYYRSQGVLPTKVKIRPAVDGSSYDSNSGIGSTGASGRGSPPRSYCPSSQLLPRRRSNNGLGLGSRGSSVRAPLGR